MTLPDSDEHNSGESGYRKEDAGARTRHCYAGRDRDEENRRHCEPEERARLHRSRQTHIIHGVGEPDRAQHERDIKMSGEVIAVGKKADGLTRICDLIEAETLSSPWTI